MDYCFTYQYYGFGRVYTGGKKLFPDKAPRDLKRTTRFSRLTFGEKEPRMTLMNTKTYPVNLHYIRHQTQASAKQPYLFVCS
jgi:hypothetical protein